MEGAWVTLHEEPIWALVHVPDLEKLDKKIVGQAIEVFKEVRKIDVMPLQERIRKGDRVQRKIDEIERSLIQLMAEKEEAEVISEEKYKELIKKAEHLKKHPGEGMSVEEAIRELK